MKTKILIVLIWVFSYTILYAAKNVNHPVLIIHSYDPSYEWTDNINKGLITTLNNPNIEIYTEYLDLLRQKYAEEYLKYVDDLFIYKYKNMKFDLIIVADDYALDYVLKKRTSLFKDTPVVFCGINDFTRDMLKGHRNITGVNEQMSIKETIELAFSLSKKQKKFAVIAGTRIPEVKNLESFKKYIKPYENKTELIYLNHLELEDIRKELSKLSEEDIVLYLSYLKSPKGVVYESDYVVKYLSESTEARFFVLQDHLIRFNALGGKIISGFSQGEAAGKIALMILDGKKPTRSPYRWRARTDICLMGRCYLNLVFPK